MELITILNRCHRFRGFVYQHAHFSADKKSIEVAVRPRKGSAAVCSRCHLPGPVTNNSPNDTLSSFSCGGFSSSFCTPCGGSTVAAAALSPSKKFPGAMANAQSLHALLRPLGAATIMERDGGGLSHFLGQGLRRGGTRRHLRAKAPGARPNRCDRRRSNMPKATST